MVLNLITKQRSLVVLAPLSGYTWTKLHVVQAPPPSEGDHYLLVLSHHWCDPELSESQVQQVNRKDWQDHSPEPPPPMLRTTVSVTALQSNIHWLISQMSTVWGARGASTSITIWLLSGRAGWQWLDVAGEIIEHDFHSATGVGENRESNTEHTGFRGVSLLEC